MRKKFWEKPICGIYKITHRESGKCYIGQSVDVFERWKVHSNFGQAKKRWQHIKHVMLKYGIDKFSFEVIEECDREMLNDREVHWIAHFNSFGEGGYNLTSGGGQGTTFSEEARAKISASRKGKTTSEETRAKLSASLKDKIHSVEHRANVSAAKKGRPTVQCPHCGKEGRGSAMKQWHFENCKIYKELGVPKLGDEEVEETTPDLTGLTTLLFPQ